MKNLLVPVDFSDSTAHVIAVTESMARAFQAKVWILHCVTDYSNVGYFIGEMAMYVPNPEIPMSQQFPEEHRRLLNLNSSLVSSGIDAEPLLVTGAAVDAILEAAEHHMIDLIIIGSHGHGALYELVVGTVTKSVIQRSGRPTLVVPSFARRTKPLVIGERHGMHESSDR